MILYVDSSSIAALHLGEVGRHQVINQLRDEAAAVATSLVSYAEVRAALALARRVPSSAPRLSATAHQSAVIALDLDWPTFFRIDPTEDLVIRAGNLAEQRLLKGYDAVQLATALTLVPQTGDQVLFSTWDRALARAALAEGLSLAHEVIS